MKPIVYSLITLFAMSIAPHAVAGWSSGGGELLQDAHNPWFVENTRVVNYCTLLSDEHFGINREKADKIIESSLRWWSRQFERTEYRPGEARLGTQEFVKKDCKDSEENVDIVFRLGVLTDEQRLYLVNPKKYVAIAVRTQYNEETLRGKGFIYVSPQSGPDQMVGPKIKHDTWQAGEGGLLQKVLVHELGHVFGISHVSQLDVGNQRAVEMLPQLMTESFPETVVTLSYRGSDLTNLDTIRNFFYFATRGQPIIVYRGGGSNGVVDPLSQVLGLSDTPWQKFEYRLEPRGVVVEVYSAVEQGGPYSKVGEIDFAGPGTSEVVEVQNVISIRLNPNEKVFRKSFGSIDGPKVLRKRFSGFFYNAMTGEKRSVIGSFGARGYEIGGIDDDKKIILDAMSAY